MELIRLPGKIYNPGTRLEVARETILDSIKFKIHKFNNRPRPSIKNRIAIFSSFSEFGSEIVSILYCIPMLLQSKYLGYYSIAMGWSGRAYLYKHIVDEFWEIDEEYQYLRDYCRAFHHDSRNLRLVEKSIKKYGRLIHSNELSIVALRDVFPNINQVKKYAAFPKISKLSYKPKTVGITARNRRCYGRNLDIEFYKKLIQLVEGMGYNVIWLGEKATTHDCPYSHIPDFRVSDLEKTLGLVSNLDFTIQFWTASSRLSGLVGTPFIIFESPDQIWGKGQEGIRLNLCTKGEKKIVIAHYQTINQNHQKGLELAKRAIEEIQEKNYESIIGAVEDPAIIEYLREQNYKRVGDK